MIQKIKTPESKLRLESERIYLRPVEISDATEEYVGWLNDPEVNRFLESRFVIHTLEGVRSYVKRVGKDQNNVFLAIIRKEDGKHIGNIKLGSIDWYHKVGDIGILIGDKKSWGKGYATEAIRALESYAFGTLNLHKLTAGAYENNVGSIKAFLKLGFFEEGRRREQVFFQGDYLDTVLLAKINNRS